MWSKKELVSQAYSSVGYAAYDFDLSSEQIQNAVRLMDTMMATWNAQGIRVGYALPSSANGSDPDDDSGLPDSALEAVYLNLGLRLAPGLGKTVSAEGRSNAKAAYDTLLIKAATPDEMQLPSGVPLGAGDRSGRVFTSAPAPDLDAGTDNDIDLE